MAKALFEIEYNDLKQVYANLKKYKLFQNKSIVLKITWLCPKSIRF